MKYHTYKLESCERIMDSKTMEDKLWQIKIDLPKSPMFSIPNVSCYTACQDGYNN